MRVKNLKWVLFAILTAVLAIYTVDLAFSSYPISYTAIESPAPVQVVEAPPARESAPALPVQLIIPAIGVDAAVQYVGLDPSGSGEMDVPSNFTDVGWYQHGVRPGMSGSAVIAGHYNGKAIPEAVFYDLERLDVGDEVIVLDADGAEEVFRVVNIATFDYDAPTTDVFMGAGEKKRLNLITCGGEWLAEKNVYDERTVVFTELVTEDE